MLSSEWAAMLMCATKSVHHPQSPPLRICHARTPITATAHVTALVKREKEKNAPTI